jgi:hypothetical protein
VRSEKPPDEAHRGDCSGACVDRCPLPGHAVACGGPPRRQRLSRGWTGCLSYGAIASEFELSAEVARRMASVFAMPRNPVKTAQSCSAGLVCQHHPLAVHDSASLAGGVAVVGFSVSRLEAQVRVGASLFKGRV